MTGAGADWRYVFDRDALGAAWHVLAPDLRGHGQSDNPSGTFSLSACADDVAELLDARGIDQVRGIGFSLGGNVLLHLALRARVRAMVVAGALGYFPPTARGIMRSMTEASRTQAEWAEARARHGDDDRVRALWSYVRTMADASEDFAPPSDGDSRAGPAPLRGWRSVAARTLIVAGDRDPLYPARHFLEMYEAVEDAALWIVPNAGHEVPFVEPTFGERALAFLTAQPEGRR